MRYEYADVLQTRRDRLDEVIVLDGCQEYFLGFNEIGQMP
jgi:hypothetical protein